ncbi:MAG TPA: Rieske (2Fe-2S) protein [Streptosporangiaceae bacterium]
MSRLEQATSLDGLVGLGQKVARVIPRGGLRDALHGVWLGHPLHPVLAQVPAGAWLSASLLDGWPGNEQASRRLVTLGLAASAPAALAGAADWSEQHEQQMRVGTVHALANAAAVSLYAGSLLLRSRGGARAMRLAGLAAAGAGGLLGGHISFRLSGGANQAEPVPHLVKPGWHALMPLTDLPERRLVRRMVGEVPVVALREGDHVHVLADRCSHLSGPLSEGTLDDGCLTCPWHGSTFRVSDGSVVHGPATAPQPSFQTRLRDGVVQICLPGAG